MILLLISLWRTNEEAHYLFIQTHLSRQNQGHVYSMEFFNTLDCVLHSTELMAIITRLVSLNVVLFGIAVTCEACCSFHIHEANQIGAYENANYTAHILHKENFFWWNFAHLHNSIRTGSITRSTFSWFVQDPQKQHKRIIMCLKTAAAGAILHCRAIIMQIWDNKIKGVLNFLSWVWEHVPVSNSPAHNNSPSYNLQVGVNK